MSDVNTRNTVAPTLTTPTLVYDGDCAFCLACVRFIRRRTRKPLEAVSYQTADLAMLGLTRQECSDAVQWVASTRRAAGHLAVSLALRHARLPWPIVGAVIGMPGVRSIAGVIYRRIAARRQCAAPTPPAA